MKKTILSTSCIGGLACTLLLIQTSSAQVLFSSGTYNQNFDSLASAGSPAWADNTTLPGWYAAKTNTAPNPPSAFTAYTAGTGSGNAGALYSFGVAGVNPVTDRALGSLASGGASVGNIAYGVRFMNDTADAITNITFTYTGEQWRNGGNVNTQALAFSYRISDTPITDPDPTSVNPWTSFATLDFKSPIVGAAATALDGNAGANRQTFTSVPVIGVVVLPGQEVFFRWFDPNDTGNDHGLALDDLTVTFTSVPPVTNPPAITGQPQSRTNNAGTIATFTVTATGTTPSYQWRKDGIDLTDGGNIFGSTTPTLTVTNVLAADAAGYSVVVTNSVGSVTSVTATLTVIDPVVRLQPLSRTNVVGDTANFFVVAAGTPLLTYQWRFNDSDIAGATAAALDVLNAQSTNQGNYSVVVSNGNGTAVTSSVATLTILTTPSTLIAGWDFNTTNAISPVAPDPSIGTGSSALLNGVTGAFANGTFSDPAGLPGFLNSGWNTATYPASDASNKTAGVQFNVSTLNYRDILLTWEERHSNTASKYTRLQYTIDGINFIDGPVITMDVTNNSFVFYYADLSSISGVNSNANFGFRIVAEWEATAIGNNNSNYVGTAASYGTSGTIRFDLVRAFGNTGSTPPPIPLSIQQSGNNVILTWSNPAFSLEAAPSVTGTYTNIPGATSPYSEPITGDAKFFRLRF